MKGKLHIAAALLLLFTTVWMSSCGTSKEVTTTTGADSPEALSRRLGMRVTAKDNLQLYTLASHWLKTPYRFGGKTRRGVDCSGFVQIVYREVYEKALANSAAAILTENCRKLRVGSLDEGDLVFFRTGTGDKRTPNHVGIYLKNGQFIHASTSKGVIVSYLGEPYYLRAWITGGRVKK